MMKLVNLVALAGVGIWTAILATTGVLFFWISPKMPYWITRTYGRGCCWLMGIQLRVHGLEKLKVLSDSKTGVILAPNHESIFDIPVLNCLPINAKWIAKKEVASLPFIGQAGRALGMYFVRRDQSGHDLNVMKEVEAGLKAGISIFIFPEGTRTRTGELLPFKKGAFRTAQNSGAPLIPIAIRGTRHIAPPGSLPAKRGHRVDVRIGDPYSVPPGPLTEKSLHEFRERLIALLAET